MDDKNINVSNGRVPITPSGNTAKGDEGGSRRKEKTADEMRKATLKKARSVLSELSLTLLRVNKTLEKIHRDSKRQNTKKETSEPQQERKSVEVNEENSQSGTTLQIIATSVQQNTLLTNYMAQSIDKIAEKFGVVGRVMSEDRAARKRKAQLSGKEKDKHLAKMLGGAFKETIDNGLDKTLAKGFKKMDANLKLLGVKMLLPLLKVGAAVGGLGLVIKGITDVVEKKFGPAIDRLANAIFGSKYDRETGIKEIKAANMSSGDNAYASAFNTGRDNGLTNEQIKPIATAHRQTTRELNFLRDYEESQARGDGVLGFERDRRRVAAKEGLAELGWSEADIKVLENKKKRAALIKTREQQFKSQREALGEKSQEVSSASFDPLKGLPTGSSGFRKRSSNAEALKETHPEFQAKMLPFLADLEKAGIPMRINTNDGPYRTVEEQNALASKGGLREGGVTNAKGETYSSYHQWGLAADLIPTGGWAVKGRPESNKDLYWATEEEWSKMHEIAKKHGLHTLGMQDAGHVEYRGKGVISTLRKKYKTPDQFLGAAAPQVAGVSNNVVGQLQTLDQTLPNISDNVGVSTAGNTEPLDTTISVPHSDSNSQQSAESQHSGDLPYKTVASADTSYLSEAETFAKKGVDPISGTVSTPAKQQMQPLALNAPTVAPVTNTTTVNNFYKDVSAFE